MEEFKQSLMQSSDVKYKPVNDMEDVPVENKDDEALNESSFFEFDDEFKKLLFLSSSAYFMLMYGMFD